MCFVCVCLTLFHFCLPFRIQHRDTRSFALRTGKAPEKHQPDMAVASNSAAVNALAGGLEDLLAPIVAEADAGLTRVLQSQDALAAAILALHAELAKLGAAADLSTVGSTPASKGSTSHTERPLAQPVAKLQSCHSRLAALDKTIRKIRARLDRIEQLADPTNDTKRGGVAALLNRLRSAASPSAAPPGPDSASGKLSSSAPAAEAQEQELSNVQ